MILKGRPSSPPHCIQPKWTLAFGLPKTGLTLRDKTGELFLADIGIPKIVFERAEDRLRTLGLGGYGSVGKFKPPFGDKFIVGIEVI